MTELDPRAKVLFEVARDALGPPQGTEARIFSKLSAAAGVSVATLSATTSAASQPSLTLLSKLGGVALRLLPTTHALPIALIAFGGTAVGLWSHARTELLPRPVSKARFVTAHVAPDSPPTPTVAPAMSSAPAVLDSALPATALAPPATASPEQDVPTRSTVTKRAQHLTRSAERAAAPVVIASEPAALAAALSAATPALSAVAATSAVFEPPPLVAHVVPPAPERPAGAPEPTRTLPRDARTEAEIRMIRDMHAAWSSGDTARLSAAIAEHRAHFPHGMLSEEREALSAMLECRQSPARASSIRARFAERFARSPYEARVGSACYAAPGDEK